MRATVLVAAATLTVAGCAVGSSPRPEPPVPAEEPRSTIEVRDFSPVPDGPPGEGSTLRVRLSYVVAPPRAERHLIVAQFPTRDGLAWGAPSHVTVSEASGMATLELPLAELYRQPLLRLPLRVRFVLAAALGPDGALARPLAETPLVPLELTPPPLGIDADLAVHLPLEQDLADHSPHHRQVLARGAVTLRDGAAEFPGNSWLLLPHLGLDQRDFAVSLWVEPAADATSYNLLEQPHERKRGRHLHLEVRDTRPYLGFYDDDLAGHRPVAGGEWTHLVYQYRQGRQETWVNGRIVGSRATGPYRGTTGLTLIGHAPAWTSPFHGRIRQVRIYQRGLDAREVTALREEGRPPARTPGPLGPVYHLRVHAIHTANNDGGDPTEISPEQVARWVNKANQMLDDAHAGLRLDFDARSDGPDWEPLVRDTAINHMSGDDGKATARADRLAARFPGKLVIIFRFAAGTGRDANRGNGFGGGQFIALPAFDQTGVTSNVDHRGALQLNEGRTQNIWQLAHDLGHFLGLPHTFGPTPKTPGQVADLLADGGSTTFDGDGIDDTPPDVGPGIFEEQGVRLCNQRNAITFLARRPDGSFLRFALSTARTNVMSYFACEPMGFTPGQVQVMRRTLQLPQRRHLIGGDRGS